MFFNRLQHLQETRLISPPPSAAFMVLPAPASSGNLDAVQMLYQRAYEDAQKAQTPPAPRELFSVMN